MLRCTVQARPLHPTRWPPYPIPGAQADAVRQAVGRLAQLAGILLMAAGVLVTAGSAFAVLARALPLRTMLAQPGVWFGVVVVVAGVAVLRSARTR